MKSLSNRRCKETLVFFTRLNHSWVNRASIGSQGSTVPKSDDDLVPFISEDYSQPARSDTTALSLDRANVVSRATGGMQGGGMTSAEPISQAVRHSAAFADQGNGPPTHIVVFEYRPFLTTSQLARNSVGFRVFQRRQSSTRLAPDRRTRSAQPPGRCHVDWSPSAVLGSRPRF